MAQVKVYECPKCSENFTASQVKSNEKRCPGCSVALKHDLDRETGAMVHRWIVDESLPLTIESPRGGEPKFEKLSERGEVPEVYRLIKPPLRETDPTYRVVYWGRYGSTDIRCPVCHGYLHTTNIISGSEQNALCRNSTTEGDGIWKKCRTRTEFRFFKNGEAFDAYND